MKLNMKYSVLPRLLALVFALALLLATAVTPVAAAKGDFTEWTYDASAKTLTAAFPNGDTEVYVRLEGSPHLRFDPDCSFLYEKSVVIDRITYSVYAAKERGDSLALVDHREGNCLIFVTKERRAELDTMAQKENDYVSLTCERPDNYVHTNMDKKFLRDLKAQVSDSDAITVTDTLYGLRYAPRYELWLYDEDTVAAVNCGFLLDLAGEMYYVGVRDLPAAALDGQGKLIASESVTVTLYRVPDEWQYSAYHAVAYGSTHHTYAMIYEKGSSGLLTDNAPAAFVYFTIAILGIAVPIAPLVLGLCLPHSAKQGYKKRWYLLAIFGGAWMLLGILVLVMMIVAL